MFRKLFSFVVLVNALAGTVMHANAGEAEKNFLSSLNGTLLAQDKPPMKNCQQVCKPLTRCYALPCKRVGDEMVCPKEERCVTEQLCRWECSR